MIESYKVGALLVLDDQASPQLEKMARTAERLEKQFAAIQGQLDTLGVNGFATKIDAQLKSVADAAGVTSDKMLASFTGLERGAVANLDVIKAASGTMFGEMAGRSDAVTAAVLGNVGHMRQGVVEQLDIVKSSTAGIWTGFTEGADTAAVAAVAAMGRVAAAVEAPIASIRSMVAEITSASEKLAAIGATSVGEAAIAGGAGARLGDRGRHVRGGPHFGRVGTEIPGGHASIAGGPGIAAAGVIGYGIYEAAEMRDEVNRLLITGQVDAAAWGEKRDQLSKLLMDSASLTGFSVSQVGEALSKSERAMSGLDVNTKMDVTKALIPYAAAEARLKETSLAESLESMVGLAHMTGTYDPAAIADLARKFSYVSLSTNASLPQFEKTLSYSMPILRTGLGMDPDTIMALTAVSQNSGITSTKSGTWLRSFFEGSEPETGDGEHAKKHNEALRNMGLLDASNVPTWKVAGADGKTDWSASVAEEAGLIAEHLKGVSVDERMGAVKNIWGERGGGMASMLSMGTFVDQFMTLAEKIQKFQGGASALEEYAKDNPAQKARETWRDFQNLLMDVGTTALPMVNKALTDLDSALKRLPADWDATKKMWSDRKDAVLDAPKAAADALGKAIPGPLGAPFRDQSHPAFDPNALPTVGFQPMADITGAGDGAKTAAEGFTKLNLKQGETIDRFGVLTDKTGLISASFDGLGTGSGTLTGKFGDLSTGSGGSTTLSRSSRRPRSAPLVRSPRSRLMDKQEAVAVPASSMPAMAAALQEGFLPATRLLTERAAHRSAAISTACSRSGITAIASGLAASMDRLRSPTGITRSHPAPWGRGAWLTVPSASTATRSGTLL